MSSVVLLAVVACVLAIPGIPASFLAFPLGQGSVITRAAAAFGLGYAVAGGCAFVLAAAHAFRLSVFLPLWLAASAVLWVLALRREPLRDQWRALAGDIAGNRLVLAAGALVLVALLVIHVRYLYVLGAPRYVYFLNGIEIANSHGVPSSTLEYGQNWPPATDKIFLDAFTGLLVLLHSSAAAGPGVLLLIATAGAFIGLWATAYELGLRKMAVLLPLAYLGNTLVLNTATSIDFTDYRAEDFGRAVAFCALAVGIAAVRAPAGQQKGWRLAIAAGVILAAASGSHLIPVVPVVFILCLAGLAAFLFRPAPEAGQAAGQLPAAEPEPPPEPDRAAERRLQPIARLACAGLVSLVLAVAIRGFAGGTFGLQGAQNQAGYSKSGVSFDPTAYLYGGSQIATSRTLWSTQPWHVIQDMATGVTQAPAWEMWLLLALPLLTAALLLTSRPLSQPTLRPLAVTGLGAMLAIIGAGLFFALSYHTYIDQTFGIRRLTPYVLIGLLLLVAGAAECLLGLLGRVRRVSPRLPAVIGLAIIVGLSAWLLPASGVSRQESYLAGQRTRLVNWVRSSTPCDARFLVNQRTEGTFTALTGRLALTEGMGAFLRTGQLPYVVALMLATQKFFHSPSGDEGFLRRHEISYVVVAREFQELGYAAPIGPPNYRQLAAAPFLQLIYSTRSIEVYKVVGTPYQRRSRLLAGPYLRCVRAPVRF